MADEERPKLAVLISTSLAFSGRMNRYQRYYKNDESGWDLLHEGCLDNQSIIQSKLGSSSLNCAVMKNELIADCQRVDANRRHVSSIPPSTKSFNQSRKADMESIMPSRPDKSDGAACGVVIVVPLGTVSFILVSERPASPWRRRVESTLVFEDVGFGSSAR